MKMHHGFDINHASRHLLASMIFAAVALTGGFARADDTTQQTDAPKKVAAVKTDDTSKKQTVAAKPLDKDAKAVADSADKLDLSTPVSRLHFYGAATMGYEATFGKTACGHQNQNGMYSQLFLGTDIQLSKGVTMSVQMQAGQYPNGLNGLGYR